MVFITSETPKCSIPSQKYMCTLTHIHKHNSTCVNTSAAASKLIWDLACFKCAFLKIVCNILRVLIWLHFISPAHFPLLSSWKHLYLRTCFILHIVASAAKIFSNTSCFSNSSGTASGECERISGETVFSLEKLQSQHCENPISEYLRSVRVWFTFFSLKGKY